MGKVSTSVLDASLDEIKTGTRLLYLDAEPADYADALTKQLGYKDSPTFGANGDYASGRRFAVSAITDGVGTATGTCTWYAIVDVTGTLLLAAEEATTPFDIASGGVVTNNAFNISQPFAA